MQDSLKGEELVDSWMIGNWVLHIPSKLLPIDKNLEDIGFEYQFQAIVYLTMVIAIPFKDSREETEDLE